MPNSRLFTRKQYKTLMAGLDLLKEMKESSLSLAERRYAWSLLPTRDFHADLLARLEENTVRAAQENK